MPPIKPDPKEERDDDRRLSVSDDNTDKSSLNQQLNTKKQDILKLSEKLARQTEKNRHSEKLQKALYRISELASGAEKLEGFYRSLHQIISQLLYADNFYIALLNGEKSALELIYFVDSEDDYAQGKDKLFTIDLNDKTLSTYLYHQKQTLLLSAKDILKLHNNQLINYQGPSAYSWLGAPLIGDSGVLGIIVVQSYSKEFCFENWHKALFDYVSYAIASTLERKTYHLNLEQKVKQRTERLQQEVDLRKKRQKIENVLLKISELANSPISLSDFYEKLHEIVSNLIYAENFYIALTDSKMIHFVYYKDSCDDISTDEISGLLVDSPSSGMTAYLIRNKKSFLSNNKEIEALAATGEINLQGPESKSWLGIPLMMDEEIIGVMVLQSYRNNQQFSEQEQLLMEYISKPVATAIQRKTSQQKLEQLVDERTFDLDQSNRKLIIQIKEKTKAEKLQRALYDIANLASGAEDMCTFYQSIHRILGSLFYAENFYIALADGNDRLKLEYFSDLKDQDLHQNSSLSTYYGSLSAQLYHSNKPLLLNWMDYLTLAKKNKLQLSGSQFVSWLGVPLIEKQSSFGIMVLQSYRQDVVYNDWHLKLLEYVSQQIAITLQRKKIKDNLESLVKERTFKLEQEIEEHKKSQQTQSALYQIAKLASKELELNEFYKELHKIIAQLVYAENFYIALNNSANEAIEMVYYVDAMDDFSVESIASLSMESIRKSVTAYVMNSGMPLLVDKQEMAILTKRKDLDIHGEQTVSWLGVPLSIDGNTIGIMTLQSYIEGQYLSEKDKELMIFVGQHVATALVRNKNRTYLKMQVEKQTRKLTVINQKLHNEISQRKYSENLQTALFRISETPQECKNDKELYARLHEIISQLMYAKSFYIALVDDTNCCFNFGYVVDEIDKDIPESIPIGKSLTSHVYYQRKIVHITRQDIERLEQLGEIESRGSYPIDWVGVPLLSGESIFGILAVQSYDKNHVYGSREVEVLSFVSTHIADALERTRAKKKLEQMNIELAKKTRKAEAANRAKSTFLATVSHEIRTPMNGILGILSLLADTRMTHKQRDYISKISISANSLLGIINNILDYSKIEEGKLELEIVSFELLELLDNLVDIFSASIVEKQLDFNINVEPNVAVSRLGDSLRVSQILINLIGNAIKFTNKGFINLTVKSTKKGRLLFQLNDSGIGVPEDKRDKIFSSFTQADDTTTRKFGGSGLGLSICQQLVSMMDGWIEVSGVYGEGSCFSFEVNVDQLKDSPLDKSLYLGIKPLLISNNDDQILCWRHLFTRYQIDFVSLSQQQFNKQQKEIPQNFSHIFIDGDNQNLQTLSELPFLKDISSPIFLLSQPNSFTPEIPQLNKSILPIPKPTKLNLILNLILHKPISPDDTVPQKKMSNKTRSKMIEIKVLLAEDNIINQQVAKEMLKQAGAIVSVVENGLLAVEACKNQSFDIILMDMQMPTMDGYQASEKIRESHSMSQLPIIAMTANVMKGDKEKCLQYGMNDYISKPINRKTFFQIIEKYL